MLAGSPCYSPTVLYAQQRMRSATSLIRRNLGQRMMWQPGLYRLILVNEGAHHVVTTRGSSRVEQGGCYLVQPGELQDMDCGRGSHASMVAFVAAQVPGSQLRPDFGLTWRLVDTEHIQPSPEAVWGVSLPLILDADLVQGINANLHSIVSAVWRSPWQRFQANTILSQLLYRLVHHYQSDAEMMDTQSPIFDSDKMPLWLKDIEGLLTQHLQRLRNTADMAELAGVSPDHFARVFARHFGQRPAEWLRSRRLLETARFLREGDESLADIANRVGFRDASSLVHAWRRSYETPPNAWRRSQR